MGRRPALHFFINIKAWGELPKEYQAILEAVCYEANTWMLAKYDAQSRSRSNGWCASGAQLQAFPAPCDGCLLQGGADEIYAETVAKNEKFKTSTTSSSVVRDDQILVPLGGEHTTIPSWQTGRRPAGAAPRK